jgi:phenylalanine-4-hydroxylase
MTEEWLLGLADDGQRVRWNWASGVEFSGVVERVQTDEGGRLRVITFSDASARLGEQILYDPAWGSFDLVAGAGVVSCFAGSADPSYYPPTEFSGVKVPRAKDAATAEEEGKVLHLYREALKLWSGPESPTLVEGFSRIDAELADHPDEWLLRWNLLESLRKVDRGEDLQAKLRDELLEIEKSDYESLPITTGLRYLEMV